MAWIASVTDQKLITTVKAKDVTKPSPNYHVSPRTFLGPVSVPAGTQSVGRSYLYF